MENTEKQKTGKHIESFSSKGKSIFTFEQKIQIIVESIQTTMSVAELCQKYYIQESQFNKWNAQFLEVGKKLVSVNSTREIIGEEVTKLRLENNRLKEMIADLVMRYDIVKNSFDRLAT